MAAIRAEVARYLKQGVTYQRLRTFLYDRITYSAGAISGTQRFFQIPVGQSSKTFLDTNLTLAGQIPSDHVFEIHSPQVWVTPVTVSQITVLAATNPLEDVNDFIRESEFKFAIVSDEKLRGPVMFFPQSGGLAGFSAMTSIGGAASNTGQTMVGTNGLPTSLSALMMGEYPVIIPPLQSITCEITTPTSITMSVDVRVWVRLDGILHRPALN